MGNMLGKRWRAAVLVAVGAAGGGAALAAASVAGNDSVITACVNVATISNASTTSTIPEPNLDGGNVNIIDTSAGETCDTAPGNGGGNALPQQLQTTLTWNASGPTGPTGAIGPPGASGANGANGTPGHVLTVASGGTLTLPNHETITVGAPVGIPEGTSVPTGKHGGLGYIKFAFPKTTRAHWIEVDAFNFEAPSSTNTGSGGANGHSQHGPVQITKEVDSASPLLLHALVTNEQFNTVLFETRPKPGHGVTTIYKLGNVLVAGDERADTLQGKRKLQLETLTLSYQTVTISNQ
jgi:type VI secretion system Hcp family effector